MPKLDRSKEKRQRIRRSAFGAAFLILFNSAMADQLQPASGTFPVNPSLRIAIVGDSTSTGAVADPSRSLALLSLSGKALRFLEPWSGHQTPSPSKYPELTEFNVTSPVAPLRRIWYSAAEEKRLGKLSLELKDRITDDFADSPEFSWGYLVGRSLGASPGHIFLVGEDGKRVEEISRQFSRLDRLNEENLPELVFVSFTINDICKESNFEMDLEAFKQGYYARFKSQFESVMESHLAAKSGTRVFVLGPLPVAAELTKPSILEKKVPFPGGHARCEDIRSGKADLEFFGWHLDDALYHMCPSVLKTQAGDEARIGKVKSLMAGIAEMQEKALQELNANDKNFRYAYIPQVSEESVEGEDIANDCFHPSMQGHMRIARIILNAIQSTKALTE